MEVVLCVHQPGSMANDGGRETHRRDGGGPPSLRNNGGFSLLETIVALALLAVVMVTLAAGLSRSVRMNSFSRSSNASLLLAAQQVERLRAQFEASDPAVTSLTGTTGCALDSQNEIDFKSPAVTGYQALVPLLFGSDAAHQTENFDVRWNLQQLAISGSNSPSTADMVYLITVSVRPADTFNSNVVTLHALVQ